jgi:peptidoglycan/LPS O-acetylase OafA/YrhL
LRGLAAILVVVLHSADIAREFVYPEGHLLLTIARNADFGRIGVTIFFLISGFLIPSSLGQKHEHGGLEFWIKRFFRLYPAYWVSILTGYVGCWVAVGRDFDLGALAANLLMFHEFLGFKSVQGLYWTLHVELVFYFLTFLLYLAGMNMNRRVLAGVSFLFLALFLVVTGLGELGLVEKADLVHRAGMTLLHLSIMYWGALLRALIANRGSNSSAVLNSALVVPAFFALLLVFGVAKVLHGVVPESSDVVRLAIAYPIGFFTFVTVVFLGSGSLQRLRWTGEISYSLYLFHPALVYPIALLFDRSGVASVVPANFGGPIIVAVSLAASIGVAFVMYRWIEKPAMSLGKAVASSVSKKTRDVRVRA